MHRIKNRISRFREPRARLPYITQALRLVWGAARGWTVASTALMVVQGLLPLASLYLMKLIVDAVESGLTSADRGAAFGRVAMFIGLTAGVNLLSALVGSIAGVVREAQSQAVSDYMYGILHAKSVEADLAYYESAEYYDTLHRAQREGPYRPLSIVNGLVQMAQNLTSATAIAGLLFSLHWAVGLVLVATALPGMMVRLRFAGKMFRWQRKRTSTERYASYLNRMLTGSDFAKEIRLLGLGKILTDRFRDLRRQIRREKINLTAKRSLADFATQIMTTLAVFGSYAFFAFQTVQGSITLGSLVMYYQAFQRGQGFIRGVLSGLAGLYENNLFLSNLYEFLDLEPQVVEPSHPRPIPRVMQNGIVLENVGFHYPTGTRNVLEDISMAILPGEHIALVGENGSGKTILIKLLCRLYDPTEGRITIDGVDLRDFKTSALRRQISTAILISHHFSTVRMADRIYVLDGGRIVESGTHDELVHMMGTYAHLYEMQAQHYR